MARYAANLLLVRCSPGASGPSALRTSHSRVSSHRCPRGDPAREAAGRACKFRYQNAEGDTVEVRFVGLIDVLDLDFVGPEEVYYSMRRMSSPQRHVRPDTKLSVLEGTSKTLGSSWWAVPARLAATKAKAKTKSRKRGA